MKGIYVIIAPNTSKGTVTATLLGFGGKISSHSN